MEPRKIALLIPRMPSTDDLIPYLRRIDAARWYTNFGVLEGELRARLEKKYSAYVVTTSSCTSGLEIVYELYKSMGLEEVTISPLTFQATALAARRAGLHVRFRDPDPFTWSDGTVAAFGLPAWRGPIIDAAAAFGEQEVPSDIVAVFSLHATKSIGIGEGGFIVTHDRGEADELRSMTNFGFLADTRTAKYRLGFAVSRGLGTNAKMSEYHAAVALASLDIWDREPWLQLYDWYNKYLPAYQVRQQQRPRGVYPIMSVMLSCSASPVMAALHDKGIETRRWYCPPLYRHPLFLDSSTKYPVAEELTQRLLGLPYHLFLTEDDVKYVCQCLTEVLALT